MGTETEIPEDTENVFKRGYEAAPGEDLGEPMTEPDEIISQHKHGRRVVMVGMENQGLYPI